MKLLPYKDNEPTWSIEYTIDTISMYQDNIYGVKMLRRLIDDGNDTNDDNRS